MATHSTEGSGTTVGVSTLGTAGRQLWPNFLDMTNSLVQ
jgi:hypothetical protein